jgi:hypothetical protein
MALEVHCYLMLPEEQPGSEQTEILRAMSGRERLRAAKRHHHSCPEAKVDDEVQRIFGHAGP